MPRCTKCEWAYPEEELLRGELCWDCAGEVLDEQNKRIAALRKDSTLRLGWLMRDLDVEQEHLQGVTDDI